MKINTHHEQFTAEIFDSFLEDIYPHNKWIGVNIFSGEFRFSFRAELLPSGKWEIDDLIKVYAYGSIYEMPSDLLNQIKMDVPRMLEEIIL